MKAMAVMEPTVVVVDGFVGVIIKQDGCSINSTTATATMAPRLDGEEGGRGRGIIMECWDRGSEIIKPNST